MSVLLNTFKSVVLKPMGHNAVSHTVTHKYKSSMGCWVHYQKIALKSEGLNARSNSHSLQPHCIECGPSIISASRVWKHPGRIFFHYFSAVNMLKILFNLFFFFFPDFMFRNFEICVRFHGRLV